VTGLPSTDEQQRAAVGQIEAQPPSRRAAQEGPRQPVDRALDAQGDVAGPGDGVHPGFHQSRSERGGASVHDGNLLAVTSGHERVDPRTQRAERLVPTRRRGLGTRVLSQQRLAQPIRIEEGLHLGLTRNAETSPARRMPGCASQSDGQLVHFADREGAVIGAVAADGPGERDQTGSTHALEGKPGVGVVLEPREQPLVGRDRDPGCAQGFEKSAA
jgi:hypothetical protein